MSSEFGKINKRHPTPDLGSYAPHNLSCMSEPSTGKLYKPVDHPKIS